MVFHRLSDKALMLAMRTASQGTRIVATMVLARLIAKEDYGRFELILAAPGILSAAGDFGITRSVTSAVELPEDEVRDTAVVLMVVMAVLLGMTALGSGWYLGNVRNDPRLVWVGLIVAATYIVQNIQAVQLALLARDLQFVRWAGIEGLTSLATVIVGIGVALAGGGVFALAIQLFLTQAFGLALTLRQRPLRVPRIFRRAALRRFYSFGWRMTLFQFANNVQAHLSKLTIGRVDGDLGVARFGRASQVRELIGHNLGATFDIVLMPLFSRAKEDPPRLRELFMRASVGVTVFTAFGAAWLVAVAPDLIRVVLGGQWHDVPPLLRAFAPGLAFNGLAYPSMILALALGNPLANLGNSLANLATLLVAAAVYMFTDLWWFAATLSALAVVPALVAARWGTRAVHVSLRELVGRLAPLILQAALAALVMWAVAAGVARWQEAHPQLFGIAWLDGAVAQAIIRVGLATVAGGLVAAAVLRYLDVRNYRDFIGLIVRPQPAEKAA